MAEEMFFPYTTTVLTGVVRGKEFKTPAYLRDTFFSNVMTSTAKYVAFDKLPDGDRALAPFVNRRVGGKRIELEGYKTEMYEPPVVGNHFTVTPEDAFMRAPGRTEYDLAGPGAFLDHQISTGLRRIENMISRREEWMCAQALLKGEITIKGDGAPRHILPPNRPQDFPPYCVRRCAYDTRDRPRPCGPRRASQRTARGSPTERPC